jgi:hypothetical protein
MTPKKEDTKKGEEYYYPRPGSWWYIYTVLGTTGKRGISVSVHKLDRDVKTLVHRRKMIPWDKWGKMHLYKYPKDWKAGIDP